MCFVINLTFVAQKEARPNYTRYFICVCFSRLVLRSEVDDVKCLLQAAERQVDSLKKERDMESIESARRLAALESKVSYNQSTTRNIVSCLDT